MGAWGDGSFDNDDAADWLIDLVSGDTLEPVLVAFDEVLTGEGYVEEDSGFMIIAAGEVVALLRGKPGQDLPEHLIAWHDEHHLPVDDTLAQQAIQAVQMVHDASELRDFWEESPEDFQVWEQGVKDLLSRLQASIAS
jgi:hypothetical protein